MKILKDSDYAALKEKADAYDALNLESEDTPVLDETPENPEEDDVKDEEEVVDESTLLQTINELNEFNNSLNEQLAAMTIRAENAEARVAELEELPADEPIGGKAPQTDENGSSLDEVNNAVKSSKDFSQSIEKVRAIL